MKCCWCVDPNAEEPSDPTTLCDAHAAEYDGVTEVQYDREADYWKYSDRL